MTQDYPLDLPSTGNEQPPLFVDVEQCRAWIEALPMAAPVQAQAQLLRQLNLLDRFTLAAGMRLALLEVLRETVLFAQGECGKRFAGKPLPLTPPEQAAFDSGQKLWQALLGGYLRCIDAARRGDASMRMQAGMLCQRGLSVLGEVQMDILRAGYQPDGKFWRQVHALLVHAESFGRAMTATDDALRSSRPQTPVSVYAELMLIQTSGMHELNPRQQNWVMRWARRWSEKLALVAEVPALDKGSLPLCVDLESDQPARYKPFAGKGARWLVTGELRKSLKKRLTLLAKGDPDHTPLKLGLGEDCQQPACGEVLRRIYPRWVKGGIVRAGERHPMNGACRFVVGVDAIHYYNAGHRPFKPQANASAEELRRQRDELAMFGRFAERFEEEYSRDHGYQLENWEAVEDWGTLDQSSGGLRLVRSLKQSGGRLGLGQLVGVQPAGASGLLLGMVRWAQVTGDELTTGIKLFPGLPVSIAVRGSGVMAAKEAYRPGFILPAVAALDLPGSLVLPPGSHKPNRVMEVWQDGVSSRYKLIEVFDRGADFERVGFDRLPD